MADDVDVSLDEKRVHGDRRPRTRLLVASELGLATVDISDDQIGRFGLAHRLLARDVAGDGRLAVATADDVLVGDADRLSRTAFEPAVAVGFRPGSEGDDTLLAAAHDGRVGAWNGHEDDSSDGVTGEWTTLGSTGETPRSIDGEFLAAADGVYRAGADLTHLGLEGVRDVAAAGPYTATAIGVHRLDGEWTAEIEGDATLVASDGRHAHAVVDGTVLKRHEGDWSDAGCPAEDVVGVAYAEATYVVTESGTLLVDPATAKDGTAGWRSRELGLDGVTGLAVL